MSLFVCLVRREGLPDDRIHVRRTREGFLTSYYDGECRIRYTRTYSGTDLQWYLAIVLSMLNTDVLPFTRVQVSAPGYPSIMYAVPDLETHAAGWFQFTQVVGQFIQGTPWVTETRVEAPSERSDGTADEDDAYSEPGVLPSVPRWVP